MDATYKTNRYRMPLLDIAGVSATNRTYYVGFSFIKNEEETSYNFILSNLRSVLEQAGIALPRTILTDKERALINAIHTVFPSTDHMLAYGMCRRIY